MSGAAAGRALGDWFRRFLLPGLAFKAVVIGGGYATGRELAEFFLPAGPWRGVAAMILATCLWSIVCALAFSYAWAAGAFDYRAFFRHLLGRGWPLFEAAYLLFVVLILAVFGAAAGAIGQALLGWPALAGTSLLGCAIAGVAAFGTAAVERLFKWVSVLLYAVYALFLALALARFGPAIAAHFAAPARPAPWLAGSVEYAGYNVVGAVVILPVLRHLTSRRDGVVAGLIAGPLAMAPAFAFFVAMIAFYPAIGAAALPSDAMLTALDLPAFRALFQLMIFGALLESGTGSVHAVLERVAAAWTARTGAVPPPAARAALAAVLLLFCMGAAGRIGLVALIADGYRLLAVVILAVFVAPLVTLGAARLAGCLPFRTGPSAL